MENGDVFGHSGGCGVVARGHKWTARSAMADVKHAAAVKSGFMAGRSI
ncbi:hypothetical protein AB4Z30_16810 [Paenibacillus sp. 2TAF8]